MEDLLPRLQNLPRQGHTYTGIHTSGSARVHLGDNYFNLNEDKKCQNQSQTHQYHIDTQSWLNIMRLESTCSWFLRHEKYLAWKRGEIATLWCPGLAGAGKSFICSAVVADLQSSLQQPGDAVLFLYFARSNIESQDPSTALGELIHQLLLTKPEVRSLLDNSTTSVPEVRRASADLLAGRFRVLQRQQQLLKSIISHFNDVLIVIDALDEFSVDRDCQLALIKSLIAVQADIDASRVSERSGSA